MGNYASRAELQARFSDDAEVAHLTDSEDTGTPDTAVLDEVIEDAEAEIESYAAMRYEVPLDVGGDTGLAARIKSLTLDLAVAKLHDRSGNVPEPNETARTRALEWLDKLSTGKIVLPSARTEATTVSREPRVTWGTAATGTRSQRLFSRETQVNL